jgi:multimeric flavodoxin WrbA
MKKITVLLGSPRNGSNSTLLAEQLAEGAREEGAGIELINLHGLNIMPCTGCGSCQESPRSGCIIEDNMQPVYDKLKSSDTIVLATPVYWFSVSAQTKTAIDRLYAIGGGDANVLGGKSFAIILTYADEDPFVSGAANAIRMFQDIAAYLGAQIEGVVCGSAYGPGEIRSNTTVMKEAWELGRKLAV